MKLQTTLTTKGQIVIPKALRERLRWRPGTRLEIETTGGNAVRLLANDADPVADAMGCLTEGDALSALEAEHRAEVAADERRRRRR